MIVLMYQTALVTVSEAFLLIAVCGASGVLARVLGSLLSSEQSARLARFHNVILFAAAGIGFIALAYGQSMTLWLMATLVSGAAGLLYARAYDLSLVGSRSDHAGAPLPTAWIVGIIIVAIFMSYLLVPILVLLPLPLEQISERLAVNSGNLFTRRPEGSTVTLASLPMLVMLLFAASSIKQWLFPRGDYRFTASSRKHLSPELLNNKHFWFIGGLYNLTLGTFIGFSFILPFVLEIVFGYSTLMLVWMAPFLGILGRPLGHWLGRLFGGTLITQVCLLLMGVFAAMAASQFGLMGQPHEMRYFDILFISLVGLVVSSAMANGSVIVTLHKVFPVAYINRALTWVGSFAMIGAVYLPLRFSLGWRTMQLDQVMTEIAAFFIIGFIFNYLAYMRRHGEFYNP